MSSARVKFGDIVRKVNDKVDPSVDDIERFVAGEHMDTDEQKIFRFGNVGEGYLGPAFHMRFKPGHILYGSRRTYLRKVAMADFEGVCSNTTFVITPSDDRLNASYLLNVMSTERFHQNSISLSKGSTNPYINFSDLAAYEFELPSIEEQQRIVELLSGVDAHAEALRSQLHIAKKTRKAVLHHLLNAGGDDWTETTLGDVAQWFSGGTPRAGRPEFYSNGHIPWVVIADMLTTEIFDTATMITEAGLLQIGGRMAPPDSVLISMYATVGRPAIARVPVATNQAVAWSVPDPQKILSQFLLFIAQHLESYISSIARGATQRNINRKILTEIEVLLPPLDEQQRIVDEILKIDSVIDETTSALNATRQLRAALLNKEIS